MRAEQYAIGLDLGTSACKGVAATPEGAVLAESAQGYAVATAQPGWAEQDPADWWRAVVACVRTIVEQVGPAHGQPSVIGMTGQMHGLVAMDEAGAVLRPCILWCDYRAIEEARQILAVVGKERLQEITCNDAHPAFTAPKLLWVRAHEPQVYGRIAHVLLPKDWLVHRMTGVFSSDPSDASGTGVFDVGAWQWSAEIMARLDFAPGWFPEVRPSGSVVGTLAPGAASELGIEPGIPVIAGAGDQAAAAVGSGAVDVGVVACSLGTSGALLTSMTRPAEGSFAHAVPGRWLLLNSMHAASVSLDWWTGIVRGGTGAAPLSVVQVAALAEGCAPGADGVTFLPFLMGERDLAAGSTLLGSFFGLRIEHGTAQLARAVLEGVAYELRRMLQGWVDRDVPVEVLRLSGGAARISTWVQILCDILAVPIQVMPPERAGAFGIASLGLHGIGRLASLEQAVQALEGPLQRAVPLAAAEYEESYRRYVKLHEYMKAFSPEAVLSTRS